MNKVFAIGFQTFHDESRRKALYLFFIFPLGCIYGSTVFTHLTPGSEKALIIDVSLSSISFFMMFVTAMIVSDFFIKEEYQGTLYFFLTNPIRWSTFVFGKTLGALVYLILAITFTGLFACMLFYFKFKQFDFSFVKSMILLVGEVMILLGYGVFGATIFSKFTNLLFVIVIYITGRLAPQFEHLKDHFDGSGEFSPLYWIFNLIPDLNRLETRDLIVLGIDLEWSGIIDSFLYALSLTVFLIILSILLLKRRYRF